jgi:hypothetical protein
MTWLSKNWLWVLIWGMALYLGYELLQGYGISLNKQSP